MPFVDTNQLAQHERRPGWLGRYFHSPSMTFAHWQFTKGADIHEHSHEQEEVWEVIEGELAVTIDGQTQVAGPGMAAIVPANTPHSVVALSDGRAIAIDYPLRPELP
ncbi:MAG TPA: cupin domain-containing protein [Phenylobacterium sp.]|jgi:quercetin dioxygenase-like cupin family protein